MEERASSKKRPLIFSSQESRPTSSRPDRKGAFGSAATPPAPPLVSVFPAITEVALLLTSMALVRDAHRQRSMMATCPASWLHWMKRALLSPVDDSGSPSWTCG